jgi:hypothetical protein
LPTLFKHPPRQAPRDGDPDDVHYVIEVTLVDTLGKPISGAEISLVNNNNGNPSSRYSDGSGYTNHGLTGRVDDLITFQTNGAKIVAATGQPSIGPQYLYLPAGGYARVQLSLDSFKQGFRPVPALPRSPLPPFAEPINYRTTLAWTPPPPNPTRDFLRGDFWGVEMPGAPQVPGVGRKYERIFSWFLPKYAPDFQQAYLTKYGGYGYTHFLLSYADSTGPTENPGKTPGAGQTLEQFMETCALVKRYVPYLHVRFGSKDFQPAHMTPQQWADFVDPIFAQLVAAKLVDEVSLGWELNLWNTPGQPLIDALRHLGRQAHAAGLTSWQHFSPHYTSWFADGDERGRFGWYDDLANDVDGLNYQTQGPQWSAQMLQARMVDTLWQFGERGNDYLFRMEEDLAFWMWDTDEVSVVVDDLPPEQIVRVTPEEANLRGYLACCTIDDVKGTSAKVFGYGNGGRMPDGSRL